eukprot:866222-Prymnesium_polylepis.1
MTPDQYMAQNQRLWEALHDSLMPRSTIKKRLPYLFEDLFSILGLGSTASKSLGLTMKQRAQA